MQGLPKPLQQLSFSTNSTSDKGQQNISGKFIRNISLLEDIYDESSEFVIIDTNRLLIGKITASLNYLKYQAAKLEKLERNLLSIMKNVSILQNNTKYLQINLQKAEK
ncbi:Hypothetical_protein [Hexamita inflata]|uniref:Hypothetical_protein n=1 Tax=Hexamita inflata TaxID=28002 RepID=A0ABP1HZ21_9EUKA